MEKCKDKECFLYSIKYENNCEGMNDIKSCGLVKPLKEKEAPLSGPFNGVLGGLPDYAYKTIEEFEEIVEYKVNTAFRAGWKMARVTNKQLMALGGEEEAD